MSTTAVKERPIIFSGPMVRAVLEGRKTQTRRIIKPQLPDGAKVWHCVDHSRGRSGFTVTRCSPHHQIVCPYGQPGDRLWVREAWHHDDAWYPDTTWKNTHVEGKGWTWVDFKADATAHDPDRDYAWRSPIHMPRWASRITLEITDVRVQRLNEISEEDARAEGVDRNDVADHLLAHRIPPPIHDFAQMWLKINGPGSWDANPWVWAITFRRAEGGAR